MSDFFLRAEAVNLGNFVDDTEDLSTIRGSGLMILDLRQPVLMAISQSPLITVGQPQLISHGASQVVYRVTLAESASPEALAEQVAGVLRKDHHFRFATISVDVSEGNYDEAREELLARNRCRQMKQLSISPAGLVPTMSAGFRAKPPWCSIDMLRPANHFVTRPNNEKCFIGQSVKVRRAFGVEQKKDFYAELEDVNWNPKLGQGRTKEPAWNFQQIAQRNSGSEDSAEIPANLYGKLAVIYIDGNRFGKKQARFCTDVEKQAEWDKAVQERRSKALTAILAQAWNSDGAIPITNQMWWQVEPDGRGGEFWRHRFETLLWGGDEVLWVVPAWFGLSVLSRFFHEVESFSAKASPPVSSRSPIVPNAHREIRNLNKPKPKAPQTSSATSKSVPFGELTYSAGLVFCHAEAPIQGIKKLAKDLAEKCKVSLSGSQERNCFSYVVLESFDQVGDEIQKSRRLHLPFTPEEIPTLDQQLMNLILNSTELNSLLSSVAWMQKHFPRGSVYQILKELRSTEDPSRETSRFARLFQRALSDVPEADGAIAKALLAPFDLTGKDGDDLKKSQVNWLHLAELWDYALDFDAATAGTGEAKR